MWSSHQQLRLEERRRNDSLRSKRHEQETRRQEAELAEQEQDRLERKERWELEKREWEIKLVHGVWRERIEIGMHLTCLLCAVVLVIAGIRSGELSVLGGSGAASLFSILWVLHRGRGKEAPAQA